MKKLLALLAVILCVVSCQKEVCGLEVDRNGEAAVTLNVGLPEDATRAAGADSALGAIGNVDMDEYDIRFILEVYDVTKNAEGVLAKERMVECGDATSASFNFRLVPGRDYKFVVWADFVENGSSADLHYDTSKGLRVVAIKDWTAIDESRDAYTEAVLVEDYSSTSMIGEKGTITLTRPFAKLRVVTNDIKHMTPNLRPSVVKVNYFSTDFYTAFDAFAEQPLDKTYAGHELVVDLSDDNYTGETPDNTGVQTLFADYFFAQEGDRVMFDLDVITNDGEAIPTVTFNTNIPVNRNNLTTVYGPILTDANNVTVTIDPVFANGTEWNPEDDNYDVEVWDGQSTKEPAYDEATKTYTVKSGAELAWIADQVNGTTRAASNDFNGKTIVLAKNIYLGGYEWTPIGGAGKNFAGKFDGKGFVVGDFVVTKQEGYAGLFGKVQLAQIDNLTVNNVKIVAHHYAGGIVGQGYVKMNNCHVNNIDITLTTNNGDWGDKAGGIIGQNLEGNMYVKNSTAKNVKIQGYRDLGGIVGMAHNNNTVENCGVENITILQDLSVNYEGTTPETLGAVIGRRGKNVTESGNTEAGSIEIAVCIAQGVSQNK